jgi:hypothetical protein
MADEPQVTADASRNEIKDTDIVFDCPHCTKSLAIDYHGAGLTIKCSDCGNDVVVPIPEGMELDDMDRTDEDQEVRIVNLRRLLSVAEERVVQLEAQVAALTVGREALDKAQTHEHERLKLIQDRLRAIQTAQDEMARALKAIADATQGI